MIVKKKDYLKLVLQWILLQAAAPAKGSVEFNNLDKNSQEVLTFPMFSGNRRFKSS